MARLNSVQRLALRRYGSVELQRLSKIESATSFNSHPNLARKVFDQQARGTTREQLAESWQWRR